MNQEEEGRKRDQLIAKCWADEGFKQKLMANPEATLKEEGAQLPAGLSVRVVENTDNVFHLVIPAKPTDLSDEDLDMVAGGGSYTLSGSPTRPPRWDLSGLCIGCF